LRACRIALLALALAALVAAPALPAAAQAASGSLVIASLETTAYPTLTAEISLPGEMASERPRFTVTENGREVKVLSAEERGAAREPLRAVLLLDVSGSMKGASLEDAKRAARAFVEGMRGDDLVALIAFADAPRVLAPPTTDRTRLLSIIDGLIASGETAVYDALGQAAALAGATGERAVVLLSDGGDTVSASSLDTAVRALKDAGVPVYAVALRTREWDPSALRAITKATGGRLLEVKDSAELLGIYRGLAEELQRTWVVTFESGRPRTKDLDVRIEAEAGGMTAAGSLVVPNPAYAGPPPADPGVRAGRPDPLLLAASLAATFAGTTLLFFAAAQLFARRRTRLDRLAFYDQTAEAARHAASDRSEFQSRLVDAVGEIAGKRGFTRMFTERLQQAGLTLRPAEFIALHLVLVIASGALTSFATGSLLLGVAVAVLATFVPLALLDAAVRRRREAFEEQLPDVLNLIAGSLRAGWGLLQAVGLVVEQGAPPASVEFERAQTEARLGLPIEVALEKMADRIGSEDFRWTVAAIAVQREVGGNLAEVLDIVAGTMRERAQTRRQIRSLTAEGRLSAIVLIALPFVELLALLIINPAYMSLLVTTPVGWAMSATGVVLLLVGIVWLNRTMSVEV
jgi:tight adherence protein B